MKNYIVAALLLSALFCCNCGYAEDIQSFQIEMINSFTDYNELNLPVRTYGQLKSHEYGYLPGIRLGYTWQNPSDSMDFRLSLAYSSGNLNYDGTTQLGAPATGTSTAKFFDVSFLSNLYVVPAVDVSLYAGVGYHTWNRGVCAASDPPGFPENYSWGYIPVGIRRTFGLDNNWSVEPDFSARFMFSGQMEMPDYNGSVSLGNKYGFNLKVPILYAIDDTSFKIVFTPWIDYGLIGASTNSLYHSGAYYMEPASSTLQYGANIGLRIAL